MAIPIISAASSILGYRRNEVFNFQPAATEDPVRWSAVGLPPGMSIETYAEGVVTGVAATDVLTQVGHGYVDGDLVWFPTLTGGAGLVTTTIYYVRDATTDTFKVATVPGGVAIDITADLSTGTVRKVSAGLISGSCPVAGTYVPKLKATNTAGESGTEDFVIGIDSASVAGEGTSGAALDWVIDVVERTAEALGGSGGVGEVVVLATWKEDDVVMLALRFTKNGVVVDPAPVTLRLVLKHLEPEVMVIEASAFEKIGSGTDTYFNLPVDVSGPLVAAALSEYEEDEGTGHDFLAEIEWTSEVQHNGAALALKSSTKTFRVRLERDIAEG